MDIKNRLKILINSLDLSLKEFSRKTGIPYQSLQNYLRGQRIPTIENLQKISSHLNINLHWLLTGEGEMFVGPKEETKAHELSVISSKKSDYYLVPKVKARLNAGTGSLETDSQIIGKYAFRMDWLHTKTTSPKSLVLMDVFGDSMEPEIKDGDTVMVDQSQKEVIIGKIYAVGFGEEIAIKQVYKEPNLLILKSINPQYRPIELPANQWEGLVRIIGRVIWWCREG